jgi:hypothetical protein
MSNRIKAVAAIAAATLAMAVGPSPASAQVAEFFSVAYPTNLTGTQAAPHVFASAAGPLTCKVAKFTGKLTERSATVSVAPTYEECTLKGEAAAVAVNGCTYTLEAGLILKENESEGGMSIVCPAEKQIVVTAGKCEVKILPTATIGFIDFKNVGEEFEAKANLAPINYSLNNKCGPKEGEYENGKLDGVYKVKGSEGRIGVA